MIKAKIVNMFPSRMPDYAYAHGIVTRPVPTIPFQQLKTFVSAPCLPVSFS